MYVLNGTMVNAETVASLDKGLIESINVLKGDNAFEKYKIEKSRKCVIEIITKDPSKSYDSDLKTQENVPLLQDDKRIFNKVDQEATFPGGTDAWIIYLKENIDPIVAVNEGKGPGNYQIILRFIVNKDGTISDIVAETYKDTKMAAACMELLKKCPKWIPATVKGKPVNAYRRQPITFAVR